MSTKRDYSPEQVYDAKKTMKGLAWFLLCFIVGVLLITALTMGNAQAAMSTSQRKATAFWVFAKYHPCPATGSRLAKCPGWVMQWKTPLEKGGEIAPYNLIWVRT